MDKRLIPAQAPNSNWLSRNGGLQWFSEGENSDYLANRVVAINSREVQHFHEQTRDLYQKMVDTAQYVAQQGLWESVGIPKSAIRLMEYSLRNEVDNYMIGRYDFAGGIEDLPLKLLEFNADTFSLLPETAWIMPEIGRPMQHGRVQPSQQIMEHLTEAFRRLMQRYPNRERTILFSSFGHEEDRLNLSVLMKAAKDAGFQMVQQVDLPRVIFSPEEGGIMVELTPQKFQRYDFWFKMVPWDIICNEEPVLLELLEEIIINQQAIVLNPAFSMLLQSKGLLPLLAERYPNHPAILAASFEEDPFDEKMAYVGKPIFGRMGDNPEVYDDEGETLLENEGDCGDYPYVYQQWADMLEDSRGYCYQPSVYWVQQPSGICFRRQEGIAIDDDAEFLGHIVEQ